MSEDFGCVTEGGGALRTSGRGTAFSREPRGLAKMLRSHTEHTMSSEYLTFYVK